MARYKAGLYPRQPHLGGSDSGGDGPNGIMGTRPVGIIYGTPLSPEEINSFQHWLDGQMAKNHRSVRWTTSVERLMDEPPCPVPANMGQIGVAVR